MSLRILLILVVIWVVGSLVYTHTDRLEDLGRRVTAWWAEGEVDEAAPDADPRIVLAAVIATVARVVAETTAEDPSPAIAQTERVKVGATTRRRASPWSDYDVQQLQVNTQRSQGGLVVPLPARRQTVRAPVTLSDGAAKRNGPADGPMGPDPCPHCDRVPVVDGTQGLNER